MEMETIVLLVVAGVIHFVLWKTGLSEHVSFHVGDSDSSDHFDLFDFDSDGD